MKHLPYAPADATALAPLLDSIGRELEERGAHLAEIEARILARREELAAGLPRTRELARLRAEAATQRRELRHCHEELERLGCSVVGTAPLTVRIPTRFGDSHRSRVWQHGPVADD